MYFARTIFMALSLLLPAFAVYASDHADPIGIDPTKQEPNITGLFFFPDGDDMIVIFNVRPSLTAACA